MYNVADTVQTDSAHRHEKTEKEGTNLATKLNATDPETMLDKVPELNDFNSVDSDTFNEIEKVGDINLRKCEDLNLTHCPRCDHSFELGNEQETQEHLEKCCD